MTRRSGSLDQSVTIRRELFPPPNSDFEPLWDLHGVEVRGKPFKLDTRRYVELEKVGRLSFIVAREPHFDMPIGYSCGHVYRDMNFDEVVAHDGLWFVQPDWRGRGIGRVLKEKNLAVLKSLGATRVYELVRNAYNHPKLMADLGYEIWGTRWTKNLTASRGSSGS